MFKFDASRFNTDEIVGSNSFCSVHPYQKERDDKKWVVKHIMVKDTPSLLKIMDEIILRFNVDHSAILPIRGYFIEPLNLKGFQVFIKMPRMKESLNEVIKRGKKDPSETLSEDKIVRWLHTLLGGLQYLHQNRIAHRNVKPQNILFDENERIKLADMRSPSFSSREEELHSLSSIQIGTAFYMAPEILNGCDLSRKKDLFLADVWALGLSFAEVCLQKTKLIKPHEQNKEATVEKILSEIRKKYSQSLTEVLKEMLAVDKAQRCSVKKALDMLEERYESLASTGLSSPIIFHENYMVFQEQLNTMKEKYLQETTELRLTQEVLEQQNKALTQMLRKKDEEIYKLKESILQKHPFPSSLSSSPDLSLPNDLERESSQMMSLLSSPGKRSGIEKKSFVKEKEFQWQLMVEKLKDNKYIALESEEYLHLRLKTKEFHKDESRKVIQEIASKLNQFEHLSCVEVEFDERDTDMMHLLSLMRVREKLIFRFEQKVFAHWVFDGKWTINKIVKSFGSNFTFLAKLDFYNDHQYWYEMFKGVAPNLPSLEELSLSLPSCTEKNFSSIAKIVHRNFPRLMILTLKSCSGDNWLPIKGVTHFGRKLNEANSTILVELYGQFANNQQPPRKFLMEFVLKYPTIKLMSYMHLLQENASPNPAVNESESKEEMILEGNT